MSRNKLTELQGGMIETEPRPFFTFPKNTLSVDGGNFAGMIHTLL